ncbi:hypothetical protein CFU_0447 [Collimonas fungivorans Ter331]|uniref:Uncharacterized protein n=1 Tax=Collimonas fungivorans (strain Ter331) TaxID=1005048 RepID=G0AGF4_COLFT|nr:hypothetical protein CFU_0447 [Collimonas fungivorans Ter331]
MHALSAESVYGERDAGSGIRGSGGCCFRHRDRYLDRRRLHGGFRYRRGCRRQRLDIRRAGWRCCWRRFRGGRCRRCGWLHGRQGRWCCRRLHRRNCRRRRCRYGRFYSRDSRRRRSGQAGLGSRRSLFALHHGYHGLFTLILAVAWQDEIFSLPPATQHIDAVLGPPALAIAQHLLVLRVRRRKCHDPVAQLVAAMPLSAIHRTVGESHPAFAFRQRVDEHAVKTIAGFFHARGVAAHFSLLHVAGQLRYLLVAVEPAHGAGTLRQIVLATPAPAHRDVAVERPGAPDFTAVAGIRGPVPGRFGRTAVRLQGGRTGRGGSVGGSCRGWRNHRCSQQCASQQHGLHPLPRQRTRSITCRAAGRTPITRFFRIPAYHRADCRVHWWLSIVEQR